MAAHGNPGETGSSIISFSLKGIDGKTYSPQDFSSSKALVIVFMCNHCPYVKAVMNRLTGLSVKYLDKGVSFVGINSNDPVTYPEDSFDNMKLFAGEYGMNFPYLFDETQETARAYDAACTPDIYLYSAERKLAYRGRIDDNWKDESAVTSRDLDKAIEMTLEGKPVDFQQVPSIGCSIKWKQ